MLKEYAWNGATWQFEEGEQPKDAVLVVKEKHPANKMVNPRSKRTTKAQVENE